MDYAKRYYLVAPETWTRMMENQTKKNADIPPGESVKKDYQERYENKYLQKNLEDTTLADAGQALKKIGLLQSAATTPPPPTGAQPPSAPTPPSKSLQDQMFDSFKSRSNSATVGNKIAKLALVLTKTPGVQVTKDEISVDGNTLNGSAFQILNNLVRTESTLLSDDSVVLLSVLASNGMIEQVQKRKLLNNKEALDYLNYIGTGKEDTFEDTSSSFPEAGAAGGEDRGWEPGSRITAEPLAQRGTRGYNRRWLDLFETGKKGKSASRGGRRNPSKCRKQTKKVHRKQGGKKCQKIKKKKK